MEAEYRWRPYRVECTGSLSTSEVKRHRARSVLGWGTAWEDLRVLPAFFCFPLLGLPPSMHCLVGGFSGFSSFFFPLGIILKIVDSAAQATRSPHHCHCVFMLFSECVEDEGPGGHGPPLEPPWFPP